MAFLPVLRQSRLLSVLVLLLLLLAAIASLYSTIVPRESSLGFLPSSSRFPFLRKSSHSGTGQGPIAQVLPKDYEASISLQLILDAAARHTEEIASSFDARRVKQDLGIDVGEGLTLETYATHLRTIWAEFLQPRSSAPPQQEHILNTVLSRLSLFPPELQPYASEPIPKYIYTTDILSPEELPDQFQSWIELNPEWTSMFVPDAGIDIWLEQSLGGGPDVPPGDKAMVIEQMLALKKNWGVVRADMFRYLILLINGGVYTDTDTASVIPISSWAKAPAIAPSHPLLSALPQLISLARNPSEGLPSAPPLPPPSLVVAIEVDSPATHANWRQQSFTRGIQIVQWTIMAKPGHPVLLDVVGRGLTRAIEVMEMEKKGAISEQEANILDWSGPGAFTDSLFRYLLVRYGFQPEEASGLKEPLRIGDVVLMPVNSFRADASEGFQGDHRVVWHGFYGRWKGKPHQQ